MGDKFLVTRMDEIREKTVIAVIGAGVCEEETAAVAYAVGKEIAKHDAVLVCGGLSGCMEHACNGAKSEGGLTIGIIPTYNKEMANKFVDIVIPTGLGHARNTLVASTADAVIAIAGSHGTLSEIGLALKLGKIVVSLGSWEFTADWENEASVMKASTPEEAVTMAMGDGT